MLILQGRRKAEESDNKIEGKGKLIKGREKWIGSEEVPKPIKNNPTFDGVISFWTEAV